MLRRAVRPQLGGGTGWHFCSSARRGTASPLSRRPEYGRSKLAGRRHDPAGA